MVSRFKKELKFTDYISLVNKNKYLLLFCAMAFLAPTWYFVERIPNYYIASGQLVMDEQKPSLSLLESKSNQRNLGYYRAIFRSQAFIDKLVQEIGIKLPSEDGIDKKRTYVMGHVDLLEGSFNSFIMVQSKTSSPQLSYALAKAATDRLVVFCRKVENEEAEKAIAAIKEQIEICLRKREDIQREKSLYTDVAKLSSLGDMAGLNALEKGYQDELVKYELYKADLEAKKNIFRALDSSVNKNSNSAQDATLAKYRSQLAILEKEKEKTFRLGLSLSPDSKLNIDIQQLEEKIIKISSMNGNQDIALLNRWQSVRKEVVSTEAELQLKKARLDAFKSAIISYRQNHPNLGQHEFEIQQLDNLLERYTGTHKRLAERLEDAVIHMQSKSGGLTLVDAPQTPSEPIGRKDYIFYVIALTVSLMVGTVLGLFREFMDDSIKTPDDVEKQLALTLLGTIPHIALKKGDIEIQRTLSKSKKLRINNRYPELVLQKGGEESLIAEAYRSLRTNIVFASPDHPVQSMLVTSSGPGEGKSLTMANTALSFAQQGEPTLIIDTDLRRPVCHHLFGMDRSPGFGELFSGTLSLDEAVRDIPQTNLKILTAGSYTPNPAELLGSKKMDAFLEELKKRFRYILFDTPPVMAVTDACILATKLDGVVLIARSCVTSMAVSERALQSLRNVNARILGCVLNDVDLTKSYNSYGYYKHYQHYYRTRKD